MFFIFWLQCTPFSLALSLAICCPTSCTSAMVTDLPFPRYHMFYHLCLWSCWSPFFLCPSTQYLPRKLSHLLLHGFNGISSMRFSLTSPRRKIVTIVLLSFIDFFFVSSRRFQDPPAADYMVHFLLRVCVCVCVQQKKYILADVQL